MAKGQTSFGKKENEKKRQQKRTEKGEKRQERQANAVSGQSLDAMLAYVDEHGHLSSTPPAPRARSRKSAWRASRLPCPSRRTRSARAR